MALSAAGFGEHRESITVLEAFVRDGHYMADITAGFLDRWCKSLGLKKPLHFPAEFLTELAAVIRIALWQRSGISSAMGEHFPPWQELLHQLIERLMADPMSFATDPAACRSPLNRRVVWLWFKRCSWTATSDLGTDMLIDAVDDDRLLDALVDLLWKRRALANVQEPHHGNPQEE